MPPRLTGDALNQARRRAVELRRQGRTLAEVSAATGLSVPTVVAAAKAFAQAGWAGVDVRPQGRPVGSGRAIDKAVEAEIRDAFLVCSPERAGEAGGLWQHQAVARWLVRRFDIDLGERTVARYVASWGIDPPDWQTVLRASTKHDAPEPPALDSRARFWCGEQRLDATRTVLFARGPRGRLYWRIVAVPLQALAVVDFLERMCTLAGRPLQLHWVGADITQVASVAAWLAANAARLVLVRYRAPEASPAVSYDSNNAALAQLASDDQHGFRKRTAMTLTHLQRLEAESIHIMREVVAEADNPVMLYSIGKDSAVMLHLAMKAFYPAKPPFPLLHVDTRWKFREMYSFRDKMVKELGLDLRVHINPEGVEKDINPFTHGSAIHTDIMKTEGLKQALDMYGFDAAFGGARRDEEKSRAKERIFSFRSAQHRWDPKVQRPELWKLYNARKHKGESMRVFPLSNWTELDIWQYIYLEDIPIVPLYYSAARPVVERDGALIMVDDERMPLKAGEVPMMRKVRFRTLGCYPLTGAVESDADTLPAIIQEMLLTKTSERQGRVIDHDSAASMEKKKQEGYF
ncbi:sulfate adenylyltransferase subunit CysD [Denitromonas ohlonensis]|uniref:Sulfate adenylyltransferase subunit 2 n=2 Tax=Denitromonas TaxID=139331 RepID=A0A557SCG1_9RHOO|nr:sulfate adenylyltransferase subunit CysD [Denitromonas ohlonensis]TVO62882.1 sulfate adenylyltransferase subunit CysD [Denitromonas ohlonensis]TVO75001.1 sulfate adenylyltransferase subunit CysD [Denitromonas ohlonensis]